MRKASLGLIFGLTCLLAVSRAQADDLATIRARLVDGYTAASAPAQDTGVAAVQKSISDQAANLLTNLQSDGKFSDLARSVGATVMLGGSGSDGGYQVLRWRDRIWAQDLQ